MFIEDLRQRFFAKIAPSQTHPGCIEWVGGRRPKGYGLLSVDGRLENATHVSWRIKHGDWPDQHLLHRCDNPPCVNPEHLFEGDDLANAQDKVDKGRAWQVLDALSVKELIALTDTRMSGQQIADLYGVSASYVSALRHGRCRHRGAPKPVERKPSACLTVEIDGKTMTIAEAVVETGLSQNALRRRARRGITGEALTAPPHKAPRKPYVRRK